MDRNDDCEQAATAALSAADAGLTFTDLEGAMNRRGALFHRDDLKQLLHRRPDLFRRDPDSFVWRLRSPEKAPPPPQTFLKAPNPARAVPTAAMRARAKLEAEESGNRTRSSSTFYTPPWVKRRLDANIVTVSRSKVLSRYHANRDCSALRAGQSVAIADGQHLARLIELSEREAKRRGHVACERCR